MPATFWLRPSRAVLVFIAAAIPLALAGLIAGMADPPKNLFLAAKKGDLAAVRRAVEEDPTIVRKRLQEVGPTLLHYAAERGQVAVIDYLVAHGAEVDAGINSGGTALHEAAGRHQPAAVERLIGLGADVNARGPAEFTPLHRVAMAPSAFSEPGERPGEAVDRLKVVRLLVEAGADVNARDTAGDTPLHLAAIDDQAPVIEYLVSQGAEIEARSNAGETPLWRAAGSTHHAFEAVKTLMRLGADPNARSKRPDSTGDGGRSVLAQAAAMGYPDLVKFLLDQGVPVRYGDGEMDTALWHALMEMHTRFGTCREDDREKLAAEKVAVIDMLADKAGLANDGKFDRRVILIAAVEHDVRPVVAYLLKHDADRLRRDDVKEAIEHIRVPDGSRGRQAETELRHLLAEALDARPMPHASDESASRRPAGDVRNLAAPPEISVSVHYRDQMLVVVTVDGTAAIVFGDATQGEPHEEKASNGQIVKTNRYHGVAYRFRFLPADGTEETTGEGTVFTRLPRLEENRVVAGTGGNDLWIKAGAIRIKWGWQSQDSAWVYYRPEETAVLLADPRGFAAPDRRLDLSRFRDLPRPKQDKAAGQPAKNG